jgi:hypothetical protein
MRYKSLAVAIFVTVIFNQANAPALADISFASANLGDVFSGTLTIDPQTPLDPANSNATEVRYDAPIGAISVLIGADLFSAPIAVIHHPLGYQGFTSWGLSAENTITSNGVAVFGYMVIGLSGGPSSTSIIPLSLASYTKSFVSVEPIDNTNTSSSPFPAFAEYDGTLDTLVQVDSSNFTFTGHITLYIDYAASELTASIPEPSTWAMLLLGFAGIGFMAYRRRSKPAC